MKPVHINSFQWHQSVGYSRQVCARMFRDGGTPEDAMRAFGVTPGQNETADWAKAVDAIAQNLCSQAPRAAA